MEAMLYTDDGTAQVAFELLKWRIMATVVGVDKQALLAWWGQLAYTDYVVLQDKDYLKTISECEGFVKTYGPSCE